MKRESLQSLLEEVQTGTLSVEEGLHRLEGFPVRDLGHTRLDTHRELRCGFPEVVFGEGKSQGELVAITEALVERHGKLLVTRIDEETARLLREHLGRGELHPRAGAFTVGEPREDQGTGRVLVVSAGTADAPVAEEAVVTARMMGARVECLFDVGVAGVHRVIEETDLLRSAQVLVCVAGMEGALPSVVAGLVDRPVIALPTSVGYGANFAGLSALLTMMNTCAAGVSVVNIDNGFGAGYVSALINRAEQGAPVHELHPEPRHTPSTSHPTKNGNTERAK